MTTFHARVRVGEDGKLVIPAHIEDAGQAVDVTVEPADMPGLTNGLPPDRWQAIFDRTEGSVDDPAFHRPEQPVFDPVPPFEPE